MSPAAFVRSPDLKQLRDEGYAATLLISTAGTAHLLVADVPYVTPDAKVACGTLIAPIGIVDYRAEPPADHTVHFIGQAPCDRHGTRLADVINSEGMFPIAPGVEASFYFSNKNADGSNFTDHYAKMTHYVRLLEAHAQAIDPEADARTYPPIEDTDGASPFVYYDNATSRAGISDLAERLAVKRVAIVGLGGTGSYVLDFIAKTPIGEIHLFDNDGFLSHNAFRAPGAASLEDLRPRPTKVDFYAQRYSVMKRNVIPHTIALTAQTASELSDMDFVFLCMEGGGIKRQLLDTLEASGTAFIDVGMGIQVATEGLFGSLQVTTSTPSQRDHLPRRVQLTDVDDENVYEQNIQIVELNALNAALAVVKWKKLVGFYLDEPHEHYCAYRIDSNEIINDDLAPT